MNAILFLIRAVNQVAIKSTNLFRNFFFYFINLQWISLLNKVKEGYLKSLFYHSSAHYFCCLIMLNVFTSLSSFTLIR